MAGLPDENRRISEVLAAQIGEHYHVLASWRQDDGGAYVYVGSTQSPSRAAAERWAREEMLMHHAGRGEPDVVSVMTQVEWKQTILDVRRRIGE